MVQRLVDVDKVEIILHSGDVRLPKLREIRKLALRPIKPQFVIHNRLLRAAGSKGQKSPG